MLGISRLLRSTPSLQKAPFANHRCKISQNARTPTATRNPAHYRYKRNCACEAQFRQQDSRRPAVQDAQDTELATADQQAKQDLYAQLLDRQKSSSPSEVSTSRNVAAQQAKLGPGQPEKGSTELIFRLERRGEGWGEEIFPHLVVEQRPWTATPKRDRNRSSRPNPWTVYLPVPNCTPLRRLFLHLCCLSPCSAVLSPYQTNAISHDFLRCYPGPIDYADRHRPSA